MDEPIRLVGTSEPTTSASATAGFEAFIVDNQTQLFRSLCLITGSRYEAEEITQDAFVRVLERWDRVRDLDDPTGYLFVRTGRSSSTHWRTYHWISGLHSWSPRSSATPRRKPAGCSAFVPRRSGLGPLEHGALFGT